QLTEIPADTLNRDRHPDGILELATLSEILVFWTEFYSPSKSKEIDPLQYSKKLEHKVKNLLNSRSYPSQIASMILPEFDYFARNFADSTARHQLTLGYLYALDYQRANHKMPSNTDFLPKDFVDPYTNSPYKVSSAS